MNVGIEDLLNRLSRQTNLNNSISKRLRGDLLSFASNNRELFMDSVKRIDPENYITLYRIYESISYVADEWMDFVVSEFARICDATTLAKSRNKHTVSTSLEAFRYFFKTECQSIDKLITAIDNGLQSDSKQVVIQCIQLYAGLYRFNNAKYRNCRTTIEHFQKSEIADIRNFADKTINLLDKPESKSLNSRFSVYSFSCFFVGAFSVSYALAVGKDSFIDLRYYVFAFIVGSLSAWLIHMFIVVNKKFSNSDFYQLVIGYGLLFSSLLVFINNNFPKDRCRFESYKVIGKGNMASGRHWGKGTPYVEIKRNNVDIQIFFSSDDQTLVDKAQRLNITTNEGLLGFEFIKTKELY